jgi:hypothetical protein
MNKKVAVMIFMLAAVVILLISLSSVIKKVNFKNHGVVTEGTVLNVSFKSKGGYANVTVSFNTPDGKEVTSTASTRMHVSSGEKVKVYYYAESPQIIDFGDGIGYQMRGVIIGGFFFLTGLFYFIRFSVTDKSDKNLRSSGLKIEAEFVAIVRDERFRAGDRNPWIIKCRWIDNRNSKEYIFVSKTYTIDPAPYLNGRSYIDVFIDPVNPEKYFMDTSFMPKGNNTIG